MNEEERQQFLNQHNRIMESNKNQIQAQQALSMFQSSDEDRNNLMQEILNPERILSRAETYLRQLRPKKTENGIIFVEPPEDEKLFNEMGIHGIMNILSLYITPNIILSNYTEDEVRVIVNNFGIEFSDLLHNEMENWGMDTRKKQHHYNMICENITNQVDAAYHRAIGGKALEAVNKSLIVTQSEPLGNTFNPIKHQKFNVLNPKTWKNI